jgi:hypothetical protein
MTFDILKFCARPSDPREHLQKPFRVGEWVYATDGRAAVRVPANACPDVTEIADPNATGPKAIGGLFDRAIAFPGDFMQIPALGDVLRCRACRGAGKLWVSECPDCDGEGSFWHGRQKYDCQNCEDEAGAEPGWIVVGSDAKGAKQVVCECCDGLGFELYSNGAVAVRSAHYSRVYLARFAVLPNVRVRPGQSAEQMTPPAVAALFEFDGGQGILMPYKV